MTITDIMLDNLAKVYAGEAYTIISSLAVGTGTAITSAALTAQTAIDGEVGDRTAVTVDRTDNTVNYEAIRSATSVLDTTNGDTITNMGLLSATSGGDLHEINTVGGITQTTAFDIEFLASITFGR